MTTEREPADEALSEDTLPSEALEGQDEAAAAAGESDESGVDAQIASAGGTVLGEASLGQAVEASQVRRAPLYKRFALLGGVIGLVAAIVLTPFAMTDQFVGRGTIFAVMAVILIPLGILLACIVAVASDKAARKPARVRSRKSR